MTRTVSIRIPNIPRWKQISGDMSPGQYGAIIARSDGAALELLEIQPVREYVGEAEAREVGFPFWTTGAYYDAADLNPARKEVKQALESMDIDLEEIEDPGQRSLAIAEALMRYGYGVDEGTGGWSKDVLHDDVEWWGGKVSGAEYLADEDDEFRREVLGEEEVDEEEFTSNPDTSFKIEGYRVVVSEGYRASVYRGRRKIGHWVIAAPQYMLDLGQVDDRYIAEAAVDAAKEREQSKQRGRSASGPGQGWGTVDYVPVETETETEARRLAASSGRRVKYHDPAPGGFVEPTGHSAQRQGRRNPGKTLGRTQGGKFGTNLDSMVYEITLHGFGDERVGSATEPPGTYAELLRGGKSMAVFLTENSELFDRAATQDEIAFLREDARAGAIVFEDSDGFVQVVYYDEINELDEDWAELVRRYVAGQYEEGFTANSRFKSTGLTLADLRAELAEVENWLAAPTLSGSVSASPAAWRYHRTEYTARRVALLKAIASMEAS